MATSNIDMADLDLRIRAAVELAIDEVADRIVADADPLTPIDTGELRASVKVDEIERPGEGYALRISYNTPYAARQHEELEYNHPEPGTQAKFLEVPFKQHAPGLGDHVARRVREAIASGR